MANAKRDDNRIPVLLGVSSTDGVTPVMPYVDPTTHRLYVTSATSGAAIASHIQVDQYTATTNQTAFTATETPITTLYVVVNGQFQTPGGGYDYSITGTTLTLNVGVPAGLQVIWGYIY